MTAAAERAAQTWDTAERRQLARDWLAVLHGILEHQLPPGTRPDPPPEGLFDPERPAHG